MKVRFKHIQGKVEITHQHNRCRRTFPYQDSFYILKVCIPVFIPVSKKGLGFQSLYPSLVKGVMTLKVLILWSFYYQTPALLISSLMTKKILVVFGMFLCSVGLNVVRFEVWFSFFRFGRFGVWFLAILSNWRFIQGLILMDEP